MTDEVIEAPAEAETPAETPEATPNTMFNPAEATPEATPESDRPEWLNERYKTPEDQAKAYNDLHKKFVQKTDDLKADVLKEVAENYGKEIGVPDDIDGYEYPENVQTPAEETDAALRTWAKENNVSPEGFKQLADMYSKTIADPAAEFAKLGTQEEAQKTIDDVNRFASKAFGADDHGTISRVMQTAEGVQFMARLMAKQTQSGVFQDEGQDTNALGNLTRDNIRQMQADPRFGEDDAYTAKVRNMWSQYGKLPVDKQR